MVNYLSNFAPHLAEITSPLRSLLKKETEFLWDEPQSNAFEKVKQKITQSPVLGYYDPKKKLKLEVDSSKDGIGACLMQECLSPYCLCIKEFNAVGNRLCSN